MCTSLRWLRGCGRGRTRNEIAPFRAFLQQKTLTETQVETGSSSEIGLKKEYYYRDEMESWKERGVLDKHDLAWSRQGSEKGVRPAPDEEEWEEIWKWIDGGGYFYVCGDKNYMAKDVHTTLIEICSEFGSMTPDEAKDFVETKLMKTEEISKRCLLMRCYAIILPIQS